MFDMTMLNTTLHCILARGGVDIDVFVGTFRVIYFEHWFIDSYESSQDTSDYISLNFETKIVYHYFSYVSNGQNRKSCQL